MDRAEQLAEAERLADGAGEALEAEAFEEALERAQRGERLARRAGARELWLELGELQCAALNQLGRNGEALRRAEELLREEPDAPDAMEERGLALWELGRVAEARVQLEELLRRDPEAAIAHHTLGLIAERSGDAREAERHFTRARALAPDDFPPPVRLGAAEFDEAVERALESLPAPVRRYLANVAVAVEDFPSDEDLAGSDPPLSPALLGMFRGAALTERRSMDPWSQFPSSIVLYQRNLERCAHDRSELVEQIGITLLHEVGHFLGLDEEDLKDRGLE